jgi:hypothetical protein
MNDTWILHLSSLYKKVVIGYLFCFNRGKKVIKPYLIVDKYYILFPWLMIPQIVFRMYNILSLKFYTTNLYAKEKNCAKCIWDLEEDLSKIGFEN